MQATQRGDIAIQEEDADGKFIKLANKGEKVILLKYIYEIHGWLNVTGF